MTAKLTLTIDEKVIARAKKFAASNDTSLSRIAEQHFRSISSSGARDKTPKTALTDKLYGSVKVPKNFDYDYKRLRDEVREEKYQKYLKNRDKATY